MGEVGIVCSLEDIFFKVDVGHFFDLKHFLLVNLLESVVVSVQVNKRDYAIGAASKLVNQLEVLH